jgi:hypothetical protein
MSQFFERISLQRKLFIKKVFFRISTVFLVFTLSVGTAVAAALTNMSDTLSSAKVGLGA